MRPKNGASEEVRTLDIYLGKVVLYQLSYARIPLQVVFMSTLSNSILEKIVIAPNCSERYIHGAHLNRGICD